MCVSSDKKGAEKKKQEARQKCAPLLAVAHDGAVKKTRAGVVGKRVVTLDVRVGGEGGRTPVGFVSG